MSLLASCSFADPEPIKIGEIATVTGDFAAYGVAEVESIKDALRGVMVERGTEVLDGDGWRATWHNTAQSRFGSRRFKTEHADMYAEYTIKTTGTRFTLNAVQA